MLVVLGSNISWLLPCNGWNVLPRNLTLGGCVLVRRWAWSIEFIRKNTSHSASSFDTKFFAISISSNGNCPGISLHFPTPTATTLVLVSRGLAKGQVVLQGRQACYLLKLKLFLECCLCLLRRPVWFLTPLATAASSHKSNTDVIPSRRWRNVVLKLNKTYTNLTQFSFPKRKRFNLKIAFAARSSRFQEMRFESVAFNWNKMKNRKSN